MEEIDAQRWVLPGLLALLILGAFFIVVTNGGGDDSSAAPDRPAQSTRTSTTKTNAKATRTSPTPAPVAASSGRFVKVQAGDTPTAIADRSGISVERLLELNPSVDPDSLKPGQNLKLAR